MIKTKDLTKRYGDVTALNNLNLEIEEGMIFGYIGPNGAGKTTTIRILCSLLKPTSGEAFIDNINVQKKPDKIKTLVGYMPDFFGVYDEMRVWEYIDFFGAAYKIPRRKRKKQIDEVLEITGSREMKDYYIDSLSRGMRQRIIIAKTLIHDPRVLFLDEPTSGLDPRARIEIRKVFLQLKDMGKTILISSHILPELANVCDKIGIIEKSNLQACGTMEEVMHQTRQNRLIEVEFRDNADKYIPLFQEQFPVKNPQRTGRVLRFEYSGQENDIEKMLKDVLEKNFPVLWFREVPVDLEEVFMKITKMEAAGSRSKADK